MKRKRGKKKGTIKRTSKKKFNNNQKFIGVIIVFVVVLVLMFSFFMISQQNYKNKNLAITGHPIEATTSDGDSGGSAAVGTSGTSGSDTTGGVKGFGLSGVYTGDDKGGGLQKVVPGGDDGGGGLQRVLPLGQGFSNLGYSEHGGGWKKIYDEELEKWVWLADLIIKPTTVVIAGVPGQEIHQNINIQNNYIPRNLEISSGNSDFVSFSEDSFSLGADEEKNVDIIIKVPELTEEETGKTYLSTIEVSGADVKAFVLFNLVVRDPDFLDNVAYVEGQNKRVGVGRKGKANILLYYTEEIPIPVKLTYGIEREDDGEFVVLTSKEEEVILDETKLIEKEFEAPEWRGKYYFYSKAVYGDIALVSRDSFSTYKTEKFFSELINNPKETIKSLWWLWIIILVALIILIIVLISTRDRAVVSRIKRITKQGERAVSRRHIKRAVRKYKEAVRLMNKLKKYKAEVYSDVTTLGSKLKKS